MFMYVDTLLWLCIPFTGLICRVVLWIGRGGVGSGSKPASRSALHLTAQVGVGCDGRLVWWGTRVLPASGADSEFLPSTRPRRYCDPSRPSSRCHDASGQVRNVFSTYYDVSQPFYTGCWQINKSAACSL